LLIPRGGSRWNNDLDWIGRLVQRAINPRAFHQDLNYSLVMDDWKDSIRLTIKDQNDAKAAVESRRQEEALAADRRAAGNSKFLKEVVRPALDAINSELVSHGLQSRITETPQDVSIEIVSNGKNRFTYTVSGNGDACIRAGGGSASISKIPSEGGSWTCDDIKRHFGVEFRSLFRQEV